MMVEALRAHLVELGVEDAVTMSQEEVMNHVDTTLVECAVDSDHFEDVVGELLIHVKAHLLTVNRILEHSEDLLA